MPVMAIGGRYGVGERLGATLASRATRLRTYVVEDSGHFVAEEAPDVFCREVDGFLTA